MHAAVRVRAISRTASRRHTALRPKAVRCRVLAASHAPKVRRPIFCKAPRIGAACVRFPAVPARLSKVHGPPLFCRAERSRSRGPLPSRLSISFRNIFELRYDRGNIFHLMLPAFPEHGLQEKKRLGCFRLSLFGYPSTVTAKQTACLQVRSSRRDLCHTRASRLNFSPFPR
jgi:hypothetical protein